MRDTHDWYDVWWRILLVLMVVTFAAWWRRCGDLAAKACGSPPVPTGGRAEMATISEDGDGAAN